MNIRSTKLEISELFVFRKANSKSIISAVPNGGYCSPSPGVPKIESCMIDLAGFTLCIGSITTPV